jgi:hypothetical protein
VVNIGLTAEGSIMESMGIHSGFVIAQIINLLLLVSWIALLIAAIVKALQLPNNLRLGWILVILFVPLFGAIMFFVLRPDRQLQER